MWMPFASRYLPKHSPFLNFSVATPLISGVHTRGSVLMAICLCTSSTLSEFCGFMKSLDIFRPTLLSLFSSQKTWLELGFDLYKVTIWLDIYLLKIDIFLHPFFSQIGYHLFKICALPVMWTLCPIQFQKKLMFIMGRSAEQRPNALLTH